MAGQAAGTAHAEGKCVPMEGRFLLAFNRADIVDVLEQASRWTCRNFAYTDDVARGKITLLSKTPVTADEAYAAFLAALTSNGIAIYPSGRYYKLARMADAKKAPIPTILEDGTEAPALEQAVTKIIRLKYADPDQLRGILGNFMSPQGADIQSVPPDILIVTDIGLNLRRLERLVTAVDRPGGGDLIRVVPVRYAMARDLADKINQIFAQAPAQPGRPASKRQLIGGVAPGAALHPAPGVANVPPPAAPAAEGPTEISIYKVLADERTNKLIVIADEKSFQRILELVKQLDVPTTGEGSIHVVFLRNANAEDLSQTLQALAQGQATAKRPTGAPGAAPIPGAPAAGPRPPISADLFSGEVKITADKASNALLVLASGSDFAVVQRLIDKLDRPRRQVFVEAVIMEVNLQTDKQFGISMHAAIPVKTDQGTGFIPLSSQTGRVSTLGALSPTGLASLVGLGGFLTGLAGPASAELKDIIPGVPSLAVLVQALQKDSDVNVLSTPHILATDNEESEITVGQNVPFQAGYNPGFNLGQAAASTAGGTAASLGGYGYLTSLIAPIQRQNVELRLKVKPQINEGDMVRLDLEEQTEEIASKDPQLGPTTAKRSVKTKIVAQDQHTVVIGGLIQDRTVQSVSKVPVLGDIPLIGWLFRDTVTTKTKTNLLLFLTPYIIRDSSDFRRILERKRQEQQEFVDQFYGKQASLYEVPIDYARKPGPYSRMRRDIRIETLKLENGGPGAPGERSIGPASEPTPSAAPAEAPARAPSREPDRPATPPAAAPAAPPAENR
jgi:general secretion pathway protein D